ncbi:MAG: type IV pilus assembly protein PilM [Candidatus Omnitrophota bacterium]|jgi:type IV pilus assembly protein PilM|nr:MAG: type IV pilus assembly protein PilM [Candidatus Omnitrophota bacterium]
MKIVPFPKVKPKIPFKPRLSFGLDLGSHFIKLVKLSVLKDSVNIEGFAVEPVGLDLEGLLKRHFQSFGIKKLNLSLSGLQTITRYTDFPKMSNDEFKQALKFEAQKHIPFPLSEVNVDGFILKDDLPDNKMLVLLAAAKKDAIESRIKLCDNLGVRLGAVDIDSIALINTFNHNYSDDESIKDKAVALLNIGATESNLNILDSGFPRLSRDIHIAGNHFTKKISDIQGLEFKEAEKIKVSPEKQTSSVISCIDNVLSNLARDLRTSFDYYESQNASSVSRIYLTGGSSMFAGLRESLTNLMGIQVEHWDVLRNITIADTVDSDKLKQYSGQLAVAIGLALRT